MEVVVSELHGAIESAGWRRGYTHRVVERVCRRVASWGQHVRNKRVRATKIECTEHSECSGAPDSCPLPLHSNSMNGTTLKQH
uniref:Uncharacterized protein n=1 Tax=Arundo donax TaxID=35708 RepID=A0A0A9BD21_ARUDO